MEADGLRQGTGRSGGDAPAGTNEQATALQWDSPLVRAAAGGRPRTWRSFGVREWPRACPLRRAFYFSAS